MKLPKTDFISCMNATRAFYDLYKDKRASLLFEKVAFDSQKGLLKFLPLFKEIN